MNDKLKDIIYISVPESLEREIGGFHVDANKLLPVESTSDSDPYDIRDLSWEQIIAGMLKILAYAPEHEDIDYYRRFVLAASPTITEELTETAIITARNGKLDLAEEIFLALRGLHPADPSTAVNLALLSEQRAKRAAQREDATTAERYVEQASELYGEALQGDDAPADVHLNAGFFFAQQQNFIEAAKHLEIYVARGDDTTRLEEAKKLLADIQKQSLSDTQFKDAYELIRAGKEAQGIEQIREFLSIHPDVWNAWFMLGWGLRRLGTYDEARDAFQKALQHGPPQPDTMNELAICNMELGSYEEARRLLFQALEVEPENTKIISNLGIVSLKLEDPDQAAAYFRTVIEIDPEDAIAQAYLNQLDT